MTKLKKMEESGFLKLVFALFTLAFLIAAVAMPDRGTMLDGFVNIQKLTCKVSTNNFDNGGYAGAFLNAGVVCLILTVLYCLPKVKANAVSFLAFVLTAGFTFWGINAVNLWFGFLGVLLYCAVKRVSPASQVNAMLFTTGLAPLISDLLLRYPNAEAVGFHWAGLLLALGVGVFIGFLLPFGLGHSPKMHKGFSLYNAAVPLGLTAFFLRAVLYKVLGVAVPGGATTSLDVASWPIANIFCFVLFGLCIVLALVLGATPKSYWALLKDSGYGVDYSQKYGNAASLMNVGVYGLFIVLYYNAIGATFNAVTFGCIFCMLSCACSGSHPRNVLPIMLGYVAMSFIMKWLSVSVLGMEFAQAINAQAVVVGLCFANALSPISGKYGWGAGVLAGAAHYLLVTSVPDLHGGFCLYNGGFTAGFICMIFLPVLEGLCRTIDDRRAAKAN